MYNIIAHLVRRLIIFLFTCNPSAILALNRPHASKKNKTRPRPNGQSRVHISQQLLGFTLCDSL